MASKRKTFVDDLDTNPTNKFISTANQDYTEVKEEVETPDGNKLTIGQTAFNLDQTETPKRKGNTNKKDINEKRSTRFSLLLTIPQYEALERIKTVRGMSLNGLISEFIDEGIKNSKEDLEKWEKIKEVLGL